MFDNKILVSCNKHNIIFLCLEGWTVLFETARRQTRTGAHEKPMVTRPSVHQGQ